MREGGFGGGGGDGQIKIPQIQMPKISGKGLRAVILVVILGGLALTGFYTVSPEQTGIVMRFGKYMRATDPGLNFKIPFGVETVTKVPVQRQLKEEFGFRTVSAGVRTQFSERGFEDESLMLTGDLNAAEVEWVVQYRIDDPFYFLFRVRNVRETFRSMTEAVVRSVVGDRTVNEVLTIGRQEIADAVEQQLQVLCDQYETGIKVEQVVLQDVNPPEQVKPAFNEVNQAQQERERLINQAQSDYNQIIPRARGEAQQTIERAQGYYIERVNEARGDSARFVAVYRAYARAPEVTRKRMYLETMSSVLPKVSNKIIIDEDIKGMLPLLNLGAPTQTKGGN